MPIGRGGRTMPYNRGRVPKRGGRGGGRPMRRSSAARRPAGSRGRSMRRPMRRR